MKNNLENIEYAKVIGPGGIAYVSLRKELQPQYRKVAFDLVKGYAFLAFIAAATCLIIRKELLHPLILLPISGFLVGYCLAYLHLFIHAAAHYDLHPDKRKNDLISDLLIGPFFGIQQKKYRKLHWLHHTKLGTKDDTEHSYFNELNTLFLLKCITAIHTFTVIFSRKKTLHSIEKKRDTGNYYLLYLFSFHAALLILLFIAGGWLLPLVWLTGLLLVFPVLATIRQLLEHRDLRASGKINYQHTDHGKVSRLFGEGLLDNSFGAAGFNRHLLHHWDPTVSYTRLQDVESFLMQCPETAAIIRESKTSYLKTFIALFKV